MDRAAVSHHPTVATVLIWLSEATVLRTERIFKTLHLKNGDDDLFINEIATSTNTDVMISRDAILTYDWENQATGCILNLRSLSLYIPAPKSAFPQSGCRVIDPWGVWHRL